MEQGGGEELENKQRLRGAGAAPGARGETVGPPEISGDEGRVSNSWGDAGNPPPELGPRSKHSSPGLDSPKQQMHCRGFKHQDEVL